MTALEGIMSEADPASLPRSILRFGLFFLALVLGILGTTAILHVPAVAVEDLTMLLPSVILALTPYLMNAMEAALGLSLMGSIVLTVVVASLCTGLYFIGLGTFRPAIAERADCGEAPMLRLSSIGTPPPRQPVAPAAAQI
jgi:hypothetical protein